MAEDLVYRLRKRAEIRRQIVTRKSVQEGKPDRIADLLEEAADFIEMLTKPKAAVVAEEHREGCLGIHCSLCGHCQTEGDGPCICYAR